MTSSDHYRSNVRDIHFNLFEVLRIQDRVLGKGPFVNLDRQTVEDALDGLHQVCVGELASSFVAGDRTPLQRDDDGSVHLPEPIKKSLRAYFEGDWHRFELPERLGGMGLPPSVRWGGFEYIAGANGAACFYMFGSTVASVIDALGTEAQKKRFVAPLLDRAWGGSMALTEPDAGSDVGAGRASAKHIEDDVWEISGTKRFITNGDFDATENIVHLVLARPHGAAPGTKGLSMFIVPKFWVNEDSSLGERNGVFCAGLEKKMGIKASATCEMVFGENRPCRGLLVGNVHDGIRQMFQLIEQARMAVGLKSMATLSTAYLNALSYCKERVQGPDMQQMTNKEAPRVSIISHPDVRRMLMMQKAHAEGMRALCLLTATVQDDVQLHGGHGDEKAVAADKRNDLLLPLVKGYCSEKAYEILSLSLQCYGGSGFCQDYPIEQYVRDQKIDSLYEGTTHIQSLDLLLRKVARDGGEALALLLKEIGATAQSTEGDPSLQPLRGALGKALVDVQGIFGALMGKMKESIYHVGFNGNRVLMALAELVIGWMWVRQAEVAQVARASAKGDDVAFYDGKLAAARFFCSQVLPGLTATRKLVEKSDLDLMSVSEESF